MRKQKSLRQLAKELEVSPSYLSMILSGQRKCPEKLQGTLSLFTDVHKPKLNGAWKAGTLPTELLPRNRIYFSPSSPPCQRECLPAKNGPPPTKLLDSELTSNSMISHW